MLNFYSCSKDSILDEVVIENISNESANLRDGNTVEIDQNFGDFVQTFEQQKSMQVGVGSIDVLNPLSFSLDWESSTYTDYFGVPSRLVNTYQSPFEFTEWMKVQVLIKEISKSDYEISTLLYIADSAFYLEKGYSPRLINFTGKVVEYSSIGTVDNAYIFYLGDIVETGNPTTMNLKPKPKCFNFGCTWWQRLGSWISGVFSGFTRGGGPSDAGGSPGDVSGLGPGWTREGLPPGGTTNPGGGGSTNAPDCEDQSSFWPQHDITIKRNYLEALSSVVHNLNISACNDPFSANGPCDITYSEILCNAEDSGCFQGGDLSESSFVNCLTGMLTPIGNDPPLPLECDIAAETFIITNGIFGWSPFDLAVLCGGIDFGGNCEDQEAFDELIWEKMAIYYSQNIEETVNEYDLPEGNFGLCYNSLSLHKIGEHYYVQISPFEIQFHHVPTNTWVEISYPNLCLSSSGRTFFEEELMSQTNIKKSFTRSIEAARLGIFTQLNNGIVPPQAFVSLQFKASLLFNLKLEFSGLPSLNTSSSGCPGVAASPVQWNCN